MLWRREERAPCRDNCGRTTPVPHGTLRDDVRNPLRCAWCQRERDERLAAHDWAGLIDGLDRLVQYVKTNRTQKPEGESV